MSIVSLKLLYILNYSILNVIKVKKNKYSFVILINNARTYYYEYNINKIIIIIGNLYILHAFNTFMENI